MWVSPHTNGSKNLYIRAIPHKLRAIHDKLRNTKNTMKSYLVKITSAVVLALAITSASIADPITGGITFAGGAVLDTTSAGTATKVTAWSSPTVESTSGSFSALPVLTPVNFTAPWSFNSGALNSLWSVGGFSFDLISSSVIFQGFGAVFVSGTGWFNGPGLTSALGNWSFTSQDPAARGVFSFSASQQVPEGGTTLLLLGAGLVALSFVTRRRLMAGSV